MLQIKVLVEKFGTRYGRSGDHNEGFLKEHGMHTVNIDGA